MYSPNNEKVYIKLSEDSKQGQIQTQIINTGANIKEEDIQQIFKPFYRIEKSRNRNTGGSGLGLYIVKQILETLDIKYSIKNTEHSVQFCMNIPLSKQQTNKLPLSRTSLFVFVVSINLLRINRVTFRFFKLLIFTIQLMLLRSWTN